MIHIEDLPILPTNEDVNLRILFEAKSNRFFEWFLSFAEANRSCAKDANRG
jgi:hypothetical protein